MSKLHGLETKACPCCNGAGFLESDAACNNCTGDGFVVLDRQGEIIYG